jgi:predicted metal-dependent HD superfamily phosphohydrolase
MNAHQAQLLRQHWESLVGPESAVSQRIYADLLQRYGEPWRHHHTLPRHIVELVELHNQLTLPHDRVVIGFTIWYHDGIFKVGETDYAHNEPRSAKLAGQQLSELGVPRGVISAVDRLILDTATHRASTRDGMLFCDMDMAVLGSSPQRYAIYCRDIRQEFGDVPDAVFLPLRRAFLQELLDRPRIYQTDFYAVQFEQAARRNLRRELEELKAA